MKSKQDQYLQAALALVKVRKLEDRVKSMREEIRKTLGTEFVSYGLNDHSKPTWYWLTVSLTDYLALYPDAKPELRTWDDGKGGQRCHMVYPYMVVGEKDDVICCVRAETPTIQVSVTETPQQQAS